MQKQNFQLIKDQKFKVINMHQLSTVHSTGGYAAEVLQRSKGLSAGVESTQSESRVRVRVLTPESESSMPSPESESQPVAAPGF